MALLEIDFERGLDLGAPDPMKPTAPVLVTMNQHGIGGRETYLDTTTTHLNREFGGRFLLLTGRLTATPSAGAYSEVREIPQSARGSVSSWLRTGRELADIHQPGLVWAHHFALLPAYLLALQQGLPILATFHGPLPKTRQPLPPLEALGIALCLDNSRPVACVSDEIANDLVALGLHATLIRLLPNRVHVPAYAAPPSHPPYRVVMLTRFEKLGHIRAAIVLLHELRKRLGCTRLSIFSDLYAHLAIRPPRLGRAEKARLLGRRWLARNFRLLSTIEAVEFKPAAVDSQGEIANSHLVLGMGRVVLEGVAAGRSTVLVGYEETVGLVTGNRFDRYARSNFSGRDCEPLGPVQTAIEAAQALLGAPSLPAVSPDRFDILSGGLAVHSALEEAAAGLCPRTGLEALALTERPYEEAQERELIAFLVSRLADNQRRIFERLAAY